MSIGIKAIKSFLPRKCLDNSELVSLFDVKEDFVSDKLGLISRHISSPKEASSDLAIKATAKLFEIGLKKEEVDLLIVCTQNPDFKLPNTASIVQHKLSLPTSVASFDLNQGCSGFVYSLAATKSIMSVLGYRNAVIVTVDPYSKIIEKNDKNTALLFGDAAAAIWVSVKSDNKILDFSFGTDGSGFDKLIVKYGGSRYPLKADGEIEDDADSKDFFLRMDGRAIFNFMMSRVPLDISNCLTKNNLGMSDIDYFIFHQASKYMLKNLQKQMKIPDKKMIYYLKHCGNTVSSSIPLAMENLLDKESLINKKVLMSGFGVGLSWGSVIMKF